MKRIIRSVNVSSRGEVMTHGGWELNRRVVVILLGLSVLAIVGIQYKPVRRTTPGLMDRIRGVSGGRPPVAHVPTKTFDCPAYPSVVHFIFFHIFFSYNVCICISF